MSIAAEELPLPRRVVRKKSYRAAMVYKKKLPRRCRDGFRKTFSNFTAMDVLDQKYWF
jgi:hypothetical protein